MEQYDLQHRHQRIILQVIDNLCQNSGLRYYLAYGTLLGAVRHRGHIPWDMDADVYVPIPDYISVCEALRHALPAEYEVLANDVDSGYEELFARVCLRGVAHQTLHVDIFPLAGVPNGHISRRVFSLVSYLTYRGYFLKKVDASFNYPTNPRKRAVARLAKALMLPFPAGFFVASYRHLSTMFDFDLAKLVQNVCGSYGLREQFPKTLLGEGTRFDFAGLALVGPEGWHDYLTRMYGDYRTPRREAYVPHKNHLVE